ncbi:MAG: glycoside hydrolase family 28 protein, partial [Lachnospiraceae bacterium]|nr:glycoside hydrolase family 28 protein [Lachnospiraceae bacterium]
NVDIIGVHFSVGDDCIAIKSGKIYMGKTYKTPSSNIMIRQCFMENGHGAITVGSEIAAGVKEITATDCLFINTDRGLRIKTRRGRGKDSVLDEITFKRIKMDQVRTPFVINSFYYCDPDGKTDYVATKEALPIDERTPEIRRIHIQDVLCDHVHVAACYFYGLPEKKIEEITMENVRFNYAEDAKPGTAAMMKGCDPTSKMGIFIRNASRVILKNVILNGNEGKNIDIAGVEDVEY